MSVHLEKRIEDPPEGHPSSLAFVAYGIIGGAMDCPVTSVIAEYMRVNRNARVVIWKARSMGGTKGGKEHSGFLEWMGALNCSDYKHIFEEQVQKFENDFPSVRGCNLFVCAPFTARPFRGLQRERKCSQYGRMIDYRWALCMLYTYDHVESVKRVTTRTTHDDAVEHLNEVKNVKYNATIYRSRHAEPTLEPLSQFEHPHSLRSHNQVFEKHLQLYKAVMGIHKLTWDTRLLRCSSLTALAAACLLISVVIRHVEYA
ncbi:uncharacterized protein BT62DRAFT_1080670 [Guyanagaster necrorhizus]|uniref:Uncharacterized protein n=1 Tax=Guyanagaster necrorhizus TaxID=856835 RepID=A0A9P7VGN1_9AGAR|nr:uncharacterized protein BT62DRAFT_1080670 [Guyanagaster necrorhizus MCA 3950]KAG7440656.1 hypothetical protein BT62DRAFT_1080670 [Guyanagaster necrorhizus MCA 3950]